MASDGRDVIGSSTELLKNGFIGQGEITQSHKAGLAPRHFTPRYLLKASYCVIQVKCICSLCLVVLRIGAVLLFWPGNQIVVLWRANREP